MRKLISLFLVFFLCVLPVFSANTWIRENLERGSVNTSYEAIWLEIKGQEVLPSRSIYWYGEGIAGYSSIDFYGFEATSGNTTTISAVPIFGNRITLDGETQTITQGTDLTDFKSSFYKFIYSSNVGITTNVTFNFLIAD
ncbi:MAG: hypothetical protein GY756_10040 [bacterium]|nr:hypothetical protein [bacterium]